MDIPVELLGPYASQYQQAFVSKGTVVDKRKSSRANFTALYKKPNHKFLQDSDARRQGRQQQLQERRKGRRSLIMNNCRQPMMDQLANGLNRLIREDSGNELSALDSSDSTSIMLQDKMEVSKNSSNRSDGSKMETQEDIDVSNSTKNISNESIKRGVDKNNTKKNVPQDQNRKPSPTIKDSRRDQLQKWKKQKEVVSRVPAKQPFKVGAPPTTKPVPVKSTTSSLLKSANTTTNASTISLPKSSASATGSSNNLKTTAGGVGSRHQAVGNSRPVASRTGQPAAAAVSKPASRPATAPVAAKVDDTRRVTRAMAKAPPPNGVTTGGISKTTVSARNPAAGGVTAANKPPTLKMKALNIDDKRGASKPAVTTSKVPTSSSGAKSGPAANKPNPASTKVTTAAGASKKTVQASLSSSKAKPVKGTSTLERKTKTPSNGKTEDSQTSSEEGVTKQNEPEKAESQEQVVRKKPPKPQAIDDAYMEMNGQFSDVCRKLGALRSEWTKLKEDQKDTIPAEVHDDIDSALGKIHLLLGSKLPQFGQLLYAYLCKDENAEEKMLASDLQGWWDVANIQIESVYKIFLDLSVLRDKNWIKVVPSPPKPDRKSEESSTFKPPQRVVPKTKPAVKARANEGLKAFLANKRKQIKSDSDIITVSEPMDVSLTSRLTSEPNESMQPVTSKANLSLNLESSINQSDENAQNNNRMFEGGFFKICSPVVTTPTSRSKQSGSFTAINESGGTPVRSAVPMSLRTPTRLPRLSSVSNDASLRRASLSMLGVRRSMGSLGKLGVVDIFAEKKLQESTETINI